MMNPKDQEKEQDLKPENQAASDPEKDPSAEDGESQETPPETPRPHRKRSGQDSNEGRPWRRISKTLAFWVIFILV
ncbi:MAG: hypothetical protein O2954_15570, partial [bacterium]|nr:hypothetical protein [bacterium]